MKKGKKVLFVFLAGFFLVGFCLAHIPEDEGRLLQLYSGWCAGTPQDPVPEINGCLTNRDPDDDSPTPLEDTDEWENAIVRAITLSNGDVVYLYLLNTAGTLYVGLCAPFANNNENHRIYLYFDQGPNGGNHDGLLTANSENMVSSTRNEADRVDAYWNGSNWVSDTEGLPPINFSVGQQYYTDRAQWEFAIPLDRGTSQQDLGVNGAGDELGFFLYIDKNPPQEDGVWPSGATATNPATWADLRLGRSKQDFTLSAPAIPAPFPVIDGNLNDPAWRGACRRDILLTNFAGQTKNARLYFCHSGGLDELFVGIRVYDSTQNANDYCQIYQEQDALPPGPPHLYPDYLLTTPYENAFRITNGTPTDYYFVNPGGGNIGSWATDVFDPIDDAGTSQYNADNQYWEYEYAIDVDAGTYDLNDLYYAHETIGFLIRYYDADIPEEANRNFWWQYGVNTDLQFVDATGNHHLALGWFSVTFGTPYLQVVHPEDEQVIETSYPIDAFSYQVGGGGVVSVAYQWAGDTDWTEMEEVEMTPFWAGDLDISSMNNGRYELRVRAEATGVPTVGTAVTTQIMHVVVRSSAATVGPVVSISSPAAGAVVSGNAVNITFAATPQSPATSIDQFAISFNGGDYNVVTSPYIWDTTNLPNGSYIFRIRARDNLGQFGYSEYRLVIVDNADPQPQSVGIISPLPGSYVKGTFTIEAIVAGDLPIARVEFWDGVPETGTQLGEDTSSEGGWTYTWATTADDDGVHTLYARAFDIEDNSLTSRGVAITVDNTAPTSAILTAPAANTYRRGVIKLTATGEDGIGVSKVVFYNGNPTAGGESLGEDKDPPYECVWATQSADDGEKNLYARVYDQADNYLDSEPVVMTVDNTPPTSCSLTGLTAGETYSGTVTIGAEARDGIGLARIEFYQNGVKIGEDTEAPYELSWDTTTVADGGYTMLARAIDLAGNHLDSAGVSIRIDNTAPQTVVLVKPKAGSYHRGEILLEVGVADNVAVVRVEFWDGVPEGTGSTELGEDTSSDGGWTYTWATTDANDGSHTLYARAFDTEGNSLTSRGVTITVDNTNPTVATLNIAPSAAAYRGIIKIVGTGTDNENGSGVGKIAFYLGNPAADGTLLGEDTYLPYECFWDTTAVDDGSFDLYIRVFDKAGNYLDSQALAVLIDNTPPTECQLAIDNPSPENVYTGTISLTCTFADEGGVGKMEFYVNSQSAYSAETPTSPHQFELDTTLYPEGQYVLQARVIDQAGNDKASNLLNVIFDHQTPQIVVIIQPKPNAYLKGEVEIEAVVSDTVQVAKVEFWRDDLTVDENKIGEDTSSEEGWKVSWNTAEGVEEGRHLLYARAIDLTTRELISVGVPVFVDNTAPTQAEITFPPADSYHRQTLKITAQAADGVKVARVEFYSGNPAEEGALLGEDLTPPYEYLWLTTQTDDGQKNLYLRVYDEVDLFTDSSPVTITIDNKKPTNCQLTAPEPGIYSEEVTLTATATDENLARIEFYKDGVKLGEDETDPFEVTWNTSVNEDGAHTLFAVAVDKADNRLSSAGVAVIIDNTPPETCVITSPQAKEVLKGTVVIEAAVADAIGMRKVEFFASLQKEEELEKIKIGEDTSNENGWQIKWETSKEENSAEDGKYLLEAVAYDQQDHTLSSAKVSVVVDNTAPLISIEKIIPSPVKVEERKEVYVEKITIITAVRDTTSGVEKVQIKITNENEDEIFKEEIVPVENTNIIFIPQLVEGKNIIALQCFDLAGNVSEICKETLVYVVPKYSQVVGPAGGIVKSPDRTMIKIPRGALLSSTKITIQTLPSDLVVKPTDSNLKLTRVYRKMGPENLVFHQLVEITIPYNETDLDPDQDGTLDFAEDKLEIFYWEGAEWVKAGVSKRDPAGNLVSASVNHLGIFGLGVDTNPGAQKNLVFLTRNPFRVEEQTTFVLDLRASSQVTIKIYDAMGDLVRVLVENKTESAGRNKSITWDGLNDFGHYVGSGVYIYRVEIKSGGQTEVITDTIGVVK